MGSNLCMKWEIGNLFLYIRIALYISSFYNMFVCFSEFGGAK